MPAPVRDLVSHVFARLDRQSQPRCWLWTGAHSGHGYGQIVVNYKKRYLHHLMYEWSFGPIPEGCVVMHACDTPACCNPAHLRAGAQIENVRDAARKGRMSWRSLRTHCKNGHEYTAENTWHRADGSRRCADCERSYR